MGRRIVVFNGRNFPGTALNEIEAMCHFITTMDKIVSQVRFHTTCHVSFVVIERLSLSWLPLCTAQG